MCWMPGLLACACEGHAAHIECVSVCGVCVVVGGATFLVAKDGCPVLGKVMLPTAGW